MVKRTNISVPTDTTTQLSLNTLNKTALRECLNTLDATTLIEHIVASVHKICSLLKDGAQLCVTAKVQACEAIEESIPLETKSCDDIVEVAGKENIDFLGCC
jgi:hypothetical protein